VIASMWFSSELQATTPVVEWGGQRVRMAMEEDFVLGADGILRWALRRQTELHLVKCGAGLGARRSALGNCHDPAVACLSRAPSTSAEHERRARAPSTSAEHEPHPSLIPILI
jgi:hypothetical protein